MSYDEDIFLEYYALYKIAAEKEKNNDVDGALELYLDILKRYAPVGIIYYERPAIILEKRKEYERALEICNLALNNPQRFNKPTWKSIKEKFTKRKTRLLNKISKANEVNNKVSNYTPKSEKEVIETNTIVKIENSVSSKAIVYPDWYISISFGESKSQSFAQAVALAQMAPQFIINNVEGKNLYQAIYSDKPNEYLQFIKLYELVSNWKSCFVVLNGKIMDRKIIGKLNYCYGDKCRSGNPDFCFGASEMTENPFGCHRLQISACNNPWTSFGQCDTSGVFHVDKVAMKNRIVSYSTPYLDCPCFSMEKVLNALDKLPDRLTRTNNYNSSYQSKMSLDELLNEYSRKNSTKKQLKEKPKSLFDKFKSIFKK